jgi:hypothetical protein
MTTFLYIWFFLSVLGYAAILYWFLKEKPLKQKLNEAESKLKVQEATNEILLKKLPATKRDKLKRFSELMGGKQDK